MQRSYLWTAFPWLLSILVIIPGCILLASNKSSLSVTHPYVLFPVLGIWAWSLIWTHYVVGTIRRLYPTLQKNIAYSKITSLLVLAFILLHPGLLAYQQYISTKELPPWSYFTFVAPSQIGFILLGIGGFILFIFYEIIEKVKEKKSVQKYWWIVNISQTIAVLSIYWHALSLGHDMTKMGWFRPYWIALGIILIPCLIHLHYSDTITVLKKRR